MQFNWQENKPAQLENGSLVNHYIYSEVCSIRPAQNNTDQTCV